MPYKIGWSRHRVTVPLNLVVYFPYQHWLWDRVLPCYLNGLWNRLLPHTHWMFYSKFYCLLFYVLVYRPPSIAPHTLNVLFISFHHHTAPPSFAVHCCSPVFYQRIDRPPSIVPYNRVLTHSPLLSYTTVYWPTPPLLSHTTVYWQTPYNSVLFY